MRRLLVSILSAMVLAAVVLAGFPGLPSRALAGQAAPAEPLADFLAGIAKRPKPSEVQAAAKRQAEAIAAAKAVAPDRVSPYVPLIGPGDVPDYFTTPNWANSPALTKFIDPLPSIPVATPDTITYPGSDYYEIELRQYTQTMHSDMPPTTLRGYVQTNLGTDGGGANTVAPAPIRYLGPLIVARRDRPVRIKFTNALPTGDGGKLFIPVDTSIMGSGMYDINYDPVTLAPIAPNLTGEFSQNRADLHLHGGRTAWISDGTPHQWITPAGEGNPYAEGVSVENVPDMWFDAAGQTIATCAGALTCTEPGATNDPGPGSQTYYYTNQQSARLLFYHDHSWGITRLNVYAGEAAGYLITDDTEQRLLADGLLPADQIPLVIQDKTFVNPDTIVATDPTWAWGSAPWNGTPGAAMTPVKGDLWYPHVYMPAQNPFNPDQGGINAMGRWMYGPWFWPPTPVCGSSPQAVKPMCIEVGTAPNPYYDPYCDPSQNGFCQPPEIPGTPLPSTTAEAFMDTVLVNGAAYPTLTVDPKQYRFRILNAAGDRFLNLQFYRAVSKVGYANPTTAPYNFSGTAPTDLTEVAMVPASAAAGFPALWPADGREGGVPDPATRGPAFIQIGTEGGFLPAPVVLPNQPIAWNLDPTMFNVGNVLPQPQGGGTLILGPAERADVIVDFTKFAGKTLILYNDAPAAFPALDPHYDYYTGAPDRTDMGGYTAIPPGVGPNVRTVMQIRVSGSGGTAPVDDYSPATLASLEAAFATAAGVPGVFAASQEKIIVGQSAYDTAYDLVFPSVWPYWGVSRISDTELGYRPVNPDGTMGAPTTLGMKPKAMHDEMGAAFDDYGRMSAKLGLEVKGATAATSTFALQNYVDPSSEIVTGDGIQIWKITHNGVDTHPIHFHLYDVQVVNRVGWDGFIRLPDPNELGWKDTIRVSPLEDTIVALRAVTPRVPFPLPDSIRPLNPMTATGTDMGFSQIDPATGGALAVPQVNSIENFGWEYVWHCHILSHEENDMMRPVILLVPPNAPANVSAVAGTLSAEVSFDPPAATGGTPVTSYIVTSSPGGFTATGAGSPITVTGLAACEAYTFSVAAVNDAGTGAPSSASNAVVIPDSVPGAPLSPSAAGGNGEATVSFAPPNLPVGACSPILDYTATSDPDGLWVTGTGSPLTVTGLTNGTTYRFTVTARNVLGSGAASVQSNPVIPGAPWAPTGVSAVKGDASAEVSFGPPSFTGAAAIDSYTATSDPDGTTVSAAGSPIVVTGLTNGTAYTFTVTATNVYGTGPASAPSNSVVPAGVPDAPTGVSAVPGNYNATVSFDAPAYTGGSAVTSYVVTSHPALIAATGAGSPITVNGLLGGTTYRFTVAAVNGAGTGPDSALSNAVIPNGAPTGVDVSPPAVRENLPIGTVVGTLVSTDPNIGDSFTYALVAGTGDSGNVLFTVSGQQLLTAAILDYEAATSHSIRVRTVDSGGLSFEGPVTVAVLNDPVDDPVPSAVAAVATRGKVNLADGLAAGFAVRGTGPRLLVIRGLGPTLGVAGALANPQIELYQGGSRIASNDNWGSLIASDKAVLAAERLTPGNTSEAALVVTLNPGSYTLVLRGVGIASGIGAIEVYDAAKR